MFRTIRNFIVNLMAAFIRDRDARHKFRNKYKRKSKFRKLRDDNRILRNENALLKHDIQAVKKELESIKTRNYLTYTASDIKRCREFLLQLNKDQLPQKYRKLIQGLDKDSIKCVSTFLNRIWIISEQIPNSAKGLIDIFTEEEKTQIDKVEKELRFTKLTDDCWVYRQYVLPTNKIGKSTMYYKHEIPKLKNIEKLRDKDFLDIGALNGGSALIFTEFTNGKIYSFEPVSLHYELLLKSIVLNECTNVVPIKMALGSKEEELPIKLQGGASTLTKNSPIYNENAPEEMVKVTTLDNFVRGKDINIGLIKVDIEGFEQEFLKGAEQTIRKFRPTMLLSIYHNASDFFDIKPMIESWNLGYEFKISRPVDGGYRYETMLLAEIS